MPTPPSQMPLAALVARARTAFANTQSDADAAPALAAYGYDAARLSSLLDLVEDVEAKMGAQGAEYAEQYAATSAATAARADVEALYSRHRQLARVAHRRGSDGYRALGLDGTVPDRADALAARAHTFYHVLGTTPALAAPLAPYRIDAAAIADGRARVDALRAAVAAQAKETGDAQRATSVRDEAAALLRASFSDFVAVAKLALSAMPQVRERLGLLERS